MSANGSNNFLNIEDANLRVRSGSVHAQGMTIGGITVGTAHGLQSVTDTSNTTSNTLQFTNATTAFKATSNIELTSATKIIVDSNVVTEYTGLATTLKSVYDVPATTGTQLEVYYDAKGESTVQSPIPDLSPNTNTGAVEGHSPTLDSTDGIDSFKFNGSSQYINAGNIGVTAGSGEYPHSMSAWIKIDTLTSTMALTQIGSNPVSAGNTIIFYINTLGNIILDISGGSNTEWYSGLLTNQWYHVSYTYNGGASGRTPTSYKLYINGVDQGHQDTGAGSGTLNLASGSTLAIGHRFAGNFFDGSVANFRHYSKILNADQVKELYDYQKDYFLGSKSQVTLYKGHLGVGVTEPSGQLELAGDERIQEYPPRALYQYDTNIEGHGVFCVSASNEYDPNHPAWEAFGDNATSASNGESVWNTPGSLYSTTSGLYTGSTTTAGINGEWIQMKAPYKLKIYTLYLDSYLMSASGRQPRNFTLLGSNDGNVWEQMKTVTDQTTGYTMAWPYSTSTGGPTHTINSTKYYSYFRIVVTATQDNTKSGTLPDGLAAIGRIKFFGTPGPTILDKGSLTLGRSLDVPRVSRYDVDTETPRYEKLVVDFDTTVNSSPTDISGKGNHAVFTGNSEYSAADKAFKFDGQPGNYIYGSNLSGLPTGNAIYSLVGWINVEPSISNWGAIVIYGSAWGVETIASLAVNTSYQIAGGIGGDHVKTTNAVITPNTWHHVAAVKKSTGVITADMFDLYVDGVLIADKTLVGGTRTQGIGSTTVMSVGGALNGVASDAFNGLISNPKIYNVALEPSEVKKLYHLGRTGRSMVISDTAVGIGKVPEAQLDVRGDIKTSGMVNNAGMGWFITGDGGNAVYTVNENWFSSNGDSSVYGTVKKTRNGADATAWNATTGFFTAPEDGMYSIDMAMFINGFDGGRWGSFELQDSNSNQVENTYTFYTANITADDVRSYSKTVFMKKDWKFRFYSAAGTVTLYIAAVHSSLNINKIS